MSRAIILLKSPPREGDDDAYFREFSSSGYKTYFVEVLKSGLSNQECLVDIIRAGPKSYVGVVVTSSRAADAWTHALKCIDKPGDWTRIPFYVIGEATARALKNLAALHPNNFSDSLILGAAHSGKSESLSQFVLTDLAARGGSGELLYLTGDKNKDTFNRMMNQGGVDVENLCVYETNVVDDLKDRIDRIAREIEQEECVSSTWIVFFAPSSSDFALPHLRRHFRLSEPTGYGTDAGMSAKLAAIGPTTANFLRDERCLTVDAVPSKPVPEQLVQAICDVDRGLQ